MNKQGIKVLIIEDSKLYQLFLRRTLEEDPQLEIGGVAATAKEALERIQAVKPDVITLDLNLPDMTDFSLLTTIVDQYHIPVIVVTSTPSASEEAIALGANDFIEKIQDGSKRAAHQFKMLLKLKIKMQASHFTGHQKNEGRPGPRSDIHVMAGKDAAHHIIALGASLGGTEATFDILKAMPVWMPPMVVVQHMPEGFTKAYALRLNRNTAMEVREAKDGDRLHQGLVLLAKGGEHMEVIRSGEGYRVHCYKGEKYGGFCPSVDLLFHSVAKAAGNKATGIILTGMGRDGAQGMLNMHNHGAYTMGQSKESCEIYGMPAAAAALNSVDTMLSTQDITTALIKRFKK